MCVRTKEKILANPPAEKWSGGDERGTLLPKVDRQDLRLLVPLLCASSILVLCGLGWGISDGVRFTWAIDAIDLETLLGAWGSRFSGGWHTTYPPLHFYLLSLVFTPFLALHALSILDLGAGDGAKAMLYTGRLLTVLLSQATLIFQYATAREIGIPRKGAAFACLVVALSPPFVYYSKTLNLDVPYLFWFSVSLFYFARALKYHRFGDHGLFLASGIMSVTTKDQAYGLFLLTVPFLWFQLHRQLQQDTGSRGVHAIRQTVSDRRVWLPSLAGVVLFAAIHNLVFNWTGFWAHVEEIVGPASRPFREFPPTLTGQVSLSLSTIWQISFASGWPMLFLCAFGLWSALRRRENRLLLALLVPVISYHVTFIGLVGYARDRFMLPTVLVLGLFAGQFVGAQLERPCRRFARRAVVAGVLIYSFLYAASVDVLMLSDGRPSVREWLETYVPPDATLMTIEGRHYHPFLVDWEHISISQAEISVSVLSHVSPDYLITTSANEDLRQTPGSEGFQFFQALDEGNTNFRLVLDYKGHVPFSFIRPASAGVSSNLDKINPRIRVFVRDT